MRHTFYFIVLLAWFALPVSGLGQEKHPDYAPMRRGQCFLFNNQPQRLNTLIDSLRLPQDSGSGPASFALSWLELMRQDALGNTYGTLKGALAIYDSVGKRGEQLNQVYAGLQVGGLLLELGNYSAALDYYSHSLRLATELGDDIYISYSNTLAARTALRLGNLELAHVQLHRAELAAPAYANNYQELQRLLTQGAYWSYMEQPQKAAQELQKVLERAADDAQPYEWATANIGLLRVALQEGQTKLAEKYVKLLARRMDTCAYLARKVRWRLVLGDYYAAIGDNQRAIACLEEELAEARAQHDQLRLSSVTLSLAAIAKKNQHWAKAYHYMQLWQTSQDSLRAQQARSLFLRADAEIRTLSEKLCSNYRQQLEETRERVQTRGRKIHIWTASALLIIGTLLYFAYRSLWRNIHSLGKTITELRHNLQTTRAQRADLTAQLRATEAHTKSLATSTEKARQRVLERQRVILKSMEYAQTIQQNVMSTAEHLKAHYPDSFLLQQSKETVSGDLFWFNHLTSHDIIILADCSGHGVAGASFSFILYMLLNMVILEQHISQPKQIIEHLHTELALLFQHAKPEFVHTIDITLSVVAIDHGTQEVVASSLSQSVFYAQPNGQLERIRGNAGGLGSGQNSYKHLDEYHLPATSGATLYLATNGFAQQVNGEKQRYGSARLLSLLQTINALPMEKQAERATSSFLHFSLGEQQLDDVSLIGIRLP